MRRLVWTSIVAGSLATLSIVEAVLVTLGDGPSFVLPLTFGLAGTTWAILSLRE